jgi:hypothetical protein
MPILISVYVSRFIWRVKDVTRTYFKTNFMLLKLKTQIQVCFWLLNLTSRKSSYIGMI